MTVEEIKNIVTIGEGYNAEFKVRIPANVRKITEEVCAFANAAGGVILLGVKNNNDIVGIDISNNKRSAIQDSLGEITPALSCMLDIVKVDGKDVGVIEVSSGEQKPYVLSGAIYVREGTNTQKLTTAEEMRDFFQQADRIYFDEISCPEFNVKSDIDKENFKVFRTMAGITSTITNNQIYKNFRLLVQNSVFKNGAVLFFGKHPELIFDTAIIRCTAFKGTNKRYIIDDKRYGGPLYKQYLQALAWLRSKLNVGYDIEGQGSGPRKEIWEIPETVFKEAIINALSHRDYYEKGGRISVELFDGRVEISNPGGLVSAIPKEEFGKRSVSRNPLIFGLFDRMDMVEQVGSGVIRMKDLMKNADLPEPEFSFEGIFTVTFKRPVNWSKKRNNYLDVLSDNQIEIMDLIASNNEISIETLSKEVGIGKSTIDNNIVKLKKMNLLKRIGSSRKGKWQLL